MSKKKTKQKLDNETISYLGFIQGIVNRMASVSATFKGFSVAIFAGAIAIAASNGIEAKCQALIIAILATTLFAVLDLYYFYQEKKYRELYDQVLNGTHPCDFKLEPPKKEKSLLWSSIKSFSFWIPYLFLLIILAGCIICSANNLI